MKRFSKKQRLFICRCLGEFCSERETVDLFEQEFGFRIGKGKVAYYRKSPRWAETIEDFRRAWKEGIIDEVMADKRSRLQMLERIYTESMKAKKYRAATAAIKQAQNELEGTKIAFTGGGNEKVKFVVQWADADGFVDADGKTHSNSPEKPS